MIAARVLLAAVAGAAFAAAQPVANWDNLRQLAHGAEVRVTLTGGRTLRGFVQQVDADSLTIDATTSQERLTRPEVRRVALKRPGHRGRNTLLGLGIGMAGGLAAGAGLDSQGGSYFPNLGKAVFTPLGALVGTVVGVALPTGGWRTVYRA